MVDLILFIWSILLMLAFFWLGLYVGRTYKTVTAAIAAIGEWLSSHNDEK